MQQIKLKVHPEKESRDKIFGCISAGGFLTVAEGSVRSGKTCTLLMAFAAYVVMSPETTFLLSGRTVKTAEQNCILEQFGLLNLLPGSTYGKVGESRAVKFSVKMPSGEILRKKIVVVGASDIRAYMQIRGNTYGGWMADEVNMHDPEFVSEAFRRTVASTDRRHYFSLNPGGPKDWIYRDYLDRYDAMDEEQRRKLGGYSWWHFTPYDNPALTEDMIASLEIQYPKGSVFYKRYVLGLRAVAEGLVYPTFDDSCIALPPDDVKVKYAGIDFGTVHPTAMGWYGRSPSTKAWYKVREWVATPEQSQSMTTSDYLDVFERITAELGGIPRMNLTIDYGGGGEALAREAEKRRWMPVNPDKSVIDGIAITARLLHTHRLFISPECPKGILGFRTYHWDDKASERGETKPVKQGDDEVDETRYVCATFIDPRVKP